MRILPPTVVGQRLPRIGGMWIARISYLMIAARDQYMKQHNLEMCVKKDGSSSSMIVYSLSIRSMRFGRRSVPSQSGVM